MQVSGGKPDRRPENIHFYYVTILRRLLQAASIDKTVSIFEFCIVRYIIIRDFLIISSTILFLYKREHCRSVGGVKNTEHY